MLIKRPQMLCTVVENQISYCVDNGNKWIDCNLWFFILMQNYLSAVNLIWKQVFTCFY